MKRLFYPLEFTVAVATLVAAITASYAVSEAFRREPNLLLDCYPETAVITGITDNDIVVVENSAGIMWEFYGSDGYEVGDMVSMIMDDMGTKHYIVDDVILDIRYAGRASDFK